MYGKRVGALVTIKHPRLDYRWLAAFAFVAVVFFVFAAPIPQDQAFHHFADAREIAGLPNFWNVVSNLPFIVIGIAGLSRLRGLANRILFTGVLLTGFGSAYYHWAPCDARLVWDRLPMTIIFMSFLGCIIAAERPAWLVALVVAGAASVIWWAVTGDLRPYALVKFGPILLVAPFLWSSIDRGYLWAIILLFGLAQAAELADYAIYSILPLSGHTIKHFIAAAATYSILRWRLRAAAYAQ
jgi:hypothetical protein